VWLDQSPKREVIAPWGIENTGSNTGVRPKAEKARRDHAQAVGRPSFALDGEAVLGQGRPWGMSQPAFLTKGSTGGFEKSGQTWKE